MAVINEYKFYGKTVTAAESNNLLEPGDNRIIQSTTDGKWSNINDYLEQDLSSNVVSDNGVVNTDSFANWNVDDEAMYP